MNRPHTNNVHPGTLDPRKPRGVEVPAFQRVLHTATVVHIGPCDCPGPGVGDFGPTSGGPAAGLAFLCLGVLLLAAGSTTAAAAGGAVLAAALAAARNGLGQLERVGRLAVTGRSGWP